MTVLRELMTCNRPVAVFEQEGIDILSAETDTSVPASTGTTTLGPAQASTAATEARLSVGEYHALQLTKCAQEEAEAPKTIIEGSSMFYTDGSMPRDYGSGISDVPMEDGTSPPPWGLPFGCRHAQTAHRIASTA
ncbi:hypothetical protein PC116_g28024 [Phytophthora cactorum]|uniref:Uncharacterized protein n=1 Tax=Phytophthora cactorum TaxID=29920 RepID=A0A329RFE4_9STRA|nr:hypothetical protein PC116_g28024 [Phytophthora cactorum]RAW23190.1 hypothetical protein PC110_g20374 [Phytophthora cactorum]